MQGPESKRMSDECKNFIAFDISTEFFHSFPSHLLSTRFYVHSLVSILGDVPIDFGCLLN